MSNFEGAPCAMLSRDFYVVSSRSDPPKKSRATVLLVDDDPVILRCHLRCLEGEFAVEMCSNGADAERCVAQGGIDVVVSDVSMPGMTGVELLGALRKRDVHLPVILASALPELDSGANALGD